VKEVFAALEGWENAVSGFSSSPSFHDAEVEVMEFASEGRILLRLQTAALSSPQKKQRATTLTFTFWAIHAVSLNGWADRNIIFDLTCRTVESGLLQIEIDGSVGVSAHIECERGSVRVGAS